MVAALKELKAFSHIPVFTEAVLSYQAGDLRSNLPFEHFLGRSTEGVVVVYELWALPDLPPIFLSSPHPLLRFPKYLYLSFCLFHSSSYK